MAILEERLDRLKALIQDDDFLAGKGLSNEVNIRLFCYDPKDEMTVNHFVSHLLKSDLNCNLVEMNLYTLFMDICADMGILDGIPAMEEQDGSEYLLEQLRYAVDEDQFVGKMENLLDKKDREVLLIDGVGDAFPFMRVHKILETIQQRFKNIPVLVFYPGVFNGTSLRLFDRLESNPYYRAFNII